MTNTSSISGGPGSASLGSERLGSENLGSGNLGSGATGRDPGNDAGALHTTGFPPRARFSFALRNGDTLDLGARTLIMGIVNVTPDSFSDGGQHASPAAALAHATRLVAEGADLLDIGGESTRPGAAEIPAAEQVRRVVPLIRDLVARCPATPLSIDTRSADVARAAVEAGAAIVNDVSGLVHDPAMAATVADLRVPAILMHMRGTPTDMRERVDYDDVVADVVRELGQHLDAARAAGIEHLIADPGLGFAKTSDQSAALLAATPRFRALQVPLLVGPSRKSFLALATGEREGDPATTRLAATIAASALAAALGAHILRVHDVQACGDAIRLADIVRQSPGSTSAASIPPEWTSRDGAARMARRPSTA